MKKITVEIPLDEAITAHGNIEHLVPFLEKTAAKTSDYYRGTGVLMSLSERIHNAIISQCSLDEINSVVE